MRPLYGAKLSTLFFNTHFSYPKTDGYWLPILDIFYKKVFESGYVSTALFLPDWQSSKGATWEKKLVSDLGIKMYN